MTLRDRAGAALRFTRTALRLPARERRFLFAAWWQLTQAWLSVRVRSARVGGELGRALARESAGPWAGAIAEPRLVALFEQAAADHVLGLTCLGRSLALQRLLDRRGIGSRIQIGARRDDDRLRMHAWVEREGRVLGSNDQPPFLAFRRVGA